MTFFVTAWCCSKKYSQRLGKSTMYSEIHGDQVVYATLNFYIRTYNCNRLDASYFTRPVYFKFKQYSFCFLHTCTCYVMPIHAAKMHSCIAEHTCTCICHLFVLQLYAEAAVLYDRAQCWDKAAAVYIKNKNWYGTNHYDFYRRV